MPATDSDANAPGECSETARRTFPPTVTPDGQLRAGGCTLGRVEAGPEGQPILRVPDRYRRRCQARGTDDVPVDLEAATEAARQYVAGQGEPADTNT